MEISKDYIYVGLFLTDYYKNRALAEICQIPKYGNYIADLNKNSKIYLDHCTLLHRSQEKTHKEVLERLKCLDLIRPLDGYVTLSMMATHIGVLENKVMTLKVSVAIKNICANETPHITICTFGDGKPVDSNKITEWTKLDKPIFLQGYFRVIEKDKSIKK